MLFKPTDSARLASAGGEGWTDVRCISELHALQVEFDLVGVLPAYVYHLAIMNYDSNNHIGPPGGIVGPLPGESASATGTRMSASRAEDRRLL
eukprot:9026142-Heterocapsa_arctica.AAC.1